MLHLLNHPLSNHVVTHLRDRTTKPVTVRTLAYQISLLLAIEATRDLVTKRVSISTPLEPYQGCVLAEPIVVVPVLRAGLAMVGPFTDLFPDVSVGYIGLERDETTAQARRYYAKLPPLQNLRAYVLDPMLATGGSAVQAMEMVRAQGAREVTLICVVCAPEGIRAVEQRHPGANIFAAVRDRELNAQKYILPGLGDFGDRLYGT
ncbi:MAG: uracil phosphoribosyltransferase [Verrucomicrobia bacterium]|nr:uracil phosphoribosyltransferase [Verrucomicrobiota bacterium]